MSVLSWSIYATWYGDMTMQNWFFTHCTWVSWWYSPQWNDVYGQIDHYLTGGQTFHMIAWVNYDFTGNVIVSWTSFASTFQRSWWTHTGFIFDDNGGIAELSVSIPWCQSFSSTPTIQPIIVAQGSGMQFHCFGQNVSGYILSIGLSWATSPFYNDVVVSAWTYQRRMTWQTLATGDYRAACTVMGPGGPGPQCQEIIPFHVWWTGGVTPTWSGCNPNFQGEITFSSYNGSIVINPSLGSYITNTTGINLQWAATEPNITTITGDFSPFGHISWIYTGTNIFTHLVTYPIQLISTTGWNNFSSSYTTTGSSGACTYTDAAKRVYVDLIPPTAPVITTPISGTTICPSILLPVARSASWDSGSNISYYRYEIYNNSGMLTGNMMSWTTTSTWASLNVSLFPLWTYYMRIVAVDNVGMTQASTTVNFTTSSQYCLGTGIVIVTPVIWLRNVDLDTIYRSDPILILGLTGPTLVNISKGMLFINNGTGIWTTGMVSSHDTIYIEMVSSDQYDTTVNSNLTILGLTGTFSITTKKSNCVLSTAEKLVIQNIYANLKDEYNNDLSKLSDFLNTFQSMVEDESDLTNSCTLEYLLSLIEADLGFDGSVDTSNHITPNCKEYSIGYDATQQAYYAPEMMNRYYFINRESLIRHLDYYNPGDCHINTYANNFRTPNPNDPMKHIAPNGKIYHFIGQYGGFSATEFTSAKYFDSMESIIRYVDLRNPPKEIWTHTVNTAFTPITFAAPNGREYRIFNTDRWYMSYKLMKVKYYPTLSELKNYINRNNPSIR